MSDYDHRELDDEEPGEDDLHEALETEEDDEPRSRAKTSSGDADGIERIVHLGR